MPIVSPCAICALIHMGSNPSPQANKLSTVKKCLNEVLKYGGSFNARDLYPVSLPPPVLHSVLKLNALDSTLSIVSVGSVPN